MSIRIDILSILPGLMHSYLQEGVVSRAVRDGILKVNTVNIRHFAADKHRTTDDYPYGGGPGLVMKAEPLMRAVEAVRTPKAKVIHLTPQGKVFRNADAVRLSNEQHLILVCGRYEGIDQRFVDKYVDEELSIGDFVLSGGELAALVLTDALARFVPGVLGNESSSDSDSFSNGLLEHPQYTKPREVDGVAVPDVLTEGNHAKIRRWQLERAVEKTKAVRPDLWAEYLREHGDPTEKQAKKRQKKRKKS